MRSIHARMETARWYRLIKTTCANVILGTTEGTVRASCTPTVSDCHSLSHNSLPETSDLVYVGCIKYDGDALADDSIYDKNTDPKMTYTMCQNLLASSKNIPPYTTTSKFRRRDRGTER